MNNKKRGGKLRYTTQSTIYGRPNTHIARMLKDLIPDAILDVFIVSIRVVVLNPLEPLELFL